jgi:hypothetical protein
MAHFAELDEHDKVLRVIVVADADTSDANGNEVESVGVDFCKRLYGDNTRWKQTSYNGNIRKNYAGIGFTYDSTRDAFIPPKPFPSWTLDEATCLWEPPTPMPNDGKPYVWDENTTSWNEVIQG